MFELHKHAWNALYFKPTYLKSMGTKIHCVSRWFYLENSTALYLFFVQWSRLRSDLEPVQAISVLLDMQIDRTVIISSFLLPQVVVVIYLFIFKLHRSAAAAPALHFVSLTATVITVPWGVKKTKRERSHVMQNPRHRCCLVLPQNRI